MNVKDPCNGGINSKQRIKFLLACNADGTYKLSPLLTGKSEKAPCSKNVGKLSREYRTNKKAQITQVIFTDCLRALDAKIGSQNKIILLFILQPHDQGIIMSLKYSY